MKRSLAMLVLACALSGSAMAGTIPTMGAPDPPPPGDIHPTDSPAPGDVHTGSDGPMTSPSILMMILDLAF